MKIKRSGKLYFVNESVVKIRIYKVRKIQNERKTFFMKSYILL